MNPQSYMGNVRKAVQEFNTKQAVFTKLGYSSEDYYDFKQGMNNWLDSPTHQMFRASQALLRGELKTKFTRMLAVEKEITKKIIGGGTITLYRGLSGALAKKIYNTIKIRKRKHVTVPLWGASSWTEFENEATGFGPVVIRYDVPTDYIISCHKSNDHVLGYDEFEFIVAVPEKKIRVHRDDVIIDQYHYDIKSKWW